MITTCSKLIYCLVLSFFIVALGATRVSAQEGEVFDLIVAHPSAREGTLELIELIMSNTTEKYGPYQVVIGPEMNRARAEEGLVSGEIHIMWGTFSKKRTSKLYPIYNFVLMAPPRVCVIAKGTQSKFQGIRTLEEWNRRGMTTGVGTYWSDVPIYKANNMLIESTAKSKLLYPMAENGRFDCFNRGAGEVLKNLSENKGYELEIERSLAFIFRGKYAGFLLTPNNQYIKERFEYGVEQTWLVDGFRGVIEEKLGDYEEEFKSLYLENRNFIPVDNPEAVHHSKVRAYNQEYIDNFIKDK